MSALAATSTGPVALPSKDATIEELAAFWAEHIAWLATVDTWTYAVKRRLMEAVRDTGPLQTPAGKLAIEPTGYEYPEEVAQEFPTLGKHTVTATVDTLAEAERILDLVTEEVPAAVVGHSIKVDGRLANTVIKDGGAPAHRLIELRKPKGKLALR